MKMNELRENYKPGSGDWFRMGEPGIYKVRIVSELFPITKAPWQDGDKPRQVFLCRIINREDESIQLWEMTRSIYNQYATLSTDEDYKFDSIPSYDIKITKEKTGPEKMNVKYIVLPAKDSEITEAEKTVLKEQKPMTEVAQKISEYETDKMAGAAPTKEGDAEHVSVENIPF